MTICDVAEIISDQDSWIDVSLGHENGTKKKQRTELRNKILNPFNCIPLLSKRSQLSVQHLGRVVDHLTKHQSVSLLFRVCGEELQRVIRNADTWTIE